MINKRTYPSSGCVFYFWGGKKMHGKKTRMIPNMCIELTLDLISSVVSQVKRYLLIFSYISNTTLMRRKKQSIAYKISFSVIRYI